jgi:PAS domain S-box-containing protein
VSPAVERVTGHAAADYTGGAIALTHPHDRAKLLEAARAGAPVEIRWLGRDGTPVWTEQRVTAELDAEGRVAAIEGIARDVTEQKTLRARLAVADRLASVGTLAAGVAHEINNPLAYVAANLAFVRDRVERTGGPDAAEMHQALTDALEGAARVRDIVQRLRRFGRPGEARRQPVDLRGEVEASISLARNEISHRARLEVELGPLPSVLAAEHELGQVFVNLLLNAAQAIPEGRAPANVVRLAGRTEGGFAVVEVRDTGVGIPPENLRRIFDPFFTTKPPGQGTGLGLSIVHGIVSSLGGTIEVESEQGMGTVFRVRLPATSDAERPAAAPPAPPPAPPRGRVLVLDDEPLVARAIARALEAHEVSELTSPREALRRVEGGERWDVVVCDLMMPEMDGPEFARRVAEAAPEMRERLVFVTGGAFTTAAEEFLDRSGHPFLEKPIDAATLRSMIAARVSRRSA